MYRTAKSFPSMVRSGQPIAETLSVRFADFPPSGDILIDDAVEGEFGWYDHKTFKTHVIGLRAKFTRIRLEMDYRAGAQQPKVWDMEFEDCTFHELLVGESVWPSNEFDYEKLFLSKPLEIYDSFVSCSEKVCDKVITTDDAVYLAYAGDNKLKHIRKMALTHIRQLPDFIDSNSFPRRADGIGVIETLLELEIEGDFDYWYNKINYSGTVYPPNEYTFTHTPDPLETIVAESMRVTEMANFIVDVQTAKIISATVRLGASR